MSGTVSGGKKAAATNMKNDPNFYRKIGTMGGKAGHTGGFASNPVLARLAGAKGGRISKRGKSEKSIARARLAKELRADGLTIIEISERIGVTAGTISKYLTSD